MQTYVRLLGAPEITWAGQSLALRPERRYQLLAWLALRGSPVSRDQLAALFWPDRDNATARRNLRKLVFDSQTLDFAPDVSGDRSTVSWQVDTDVAEFERALAEGRHDDALRLYRGPLCDGLEDAHNEAFAEALRFERMRLSERWRAAAQTQLERTDRDAHTTLALAQRLIAADSLDEEAVVAAMRASVTLGQRPAALQLFRAFNEQLADTLGIEPSTRLRELARGIEAGTEARRPLPASIAASIVGRVAELQELRTLLARDECRLLTISGPGGIGKSRLAKAALPMLEAEFGDGTWWVPLDDLDDAALVAPRLAQIAGIQLAENASPIETVGAFLSKRQTLLVLDNSEQVEGLAVLINRLLALAPQLKLITTSRRRLGATGEWLLPLSGLAVPPDSVEGTAALEFDAMQLFALRAREARPGFDVACESDAMARLVCRLGGLPLAIELAAHWVRLLPVSEIESEVVSSLDVLEREEEGDERAEHRSVRATFEQSWRLLAPAEQRTLASLGVFVGTFSRAAAREVAQATLPLLGSLADKSLLRSGDDGRFSLHPLLRIFCREKLCASGETETVGELHAGWFNRRLAARHEALRDGEARALTETEQEFEDCRVAWHWAIEAQAVAAVADSGLGLQYFTQLRGRPEEGLELLENAAATLRTTHRSDRLAAAKLQRAIAQLNYRLGRFADAIACARRALRLCRNFGDQDGVMKCLGVMGLGHWQLGSYAEAKRCFDDALRRARAVDDAGHIATYLGNLGFIEKVLGNYERALVLLREAMERQKEIGDVVGVGNQYVSLGIVHRARREWQDALRSFETGLVHSETHGHIRGLPWFLILIARTYLDLGDVDRADELGRRAIERARQIGHRQVQAQGWLHMARIALRRADPTAAESHLREAIKLAQELGLEPAQLECVACFGDLLAAQGDVQSAAEHWMYVARHPKTEAAERADSQSRLVTLPTESTAGVVAPEETLATLTTSMLVRLTTTTLSPSEVTVT